MVIDGNLHKYQGQYAQIEGGMRHVDLLSQVSDSSLAWRTAHAHLPYEYHDPVLGTRCTLITQNFPSHTLDFEF